MPRGYYPRYSSSSRTKKYTGYGGYRPKFRPPVTYRPVFVYGGKGAYHKKPRTLRGAGDYKFSKKGGKPSMGAQVGAWVGDKIQGLAKSLLGFGDYKINKNVLMETNDPPKIVNAGKEFVMRHREYITDIYSAAGSANGVSAFNNQSFPINPGQYGTFTWAASIAQHFEEYRVEGIVFEFKSMYSDAVVTQNGALGNVILATEYNAGQPPFANKQQMENYEFAQSGKPSCSILHPVECARSQTVLTELYVRPGAVPAGEDIKMYDLGNFQIATQGIPLGGAGAAVDLGELWISYQIVFLKPKILTSGAVYEDSGYFHASATYLGNAAGTVTAFVATSVGAGGTGVVISPSSNLPLTFTPAYVAGGSSVATTLNIPLLSFPMLYEIVYTMNDPNGNNSASWGAPSVSSVTNGALQNIINGTIAGTSYFQVPGRGAAATTCGCSTSFVFLANAAVGAVNNATIVFGNTTIPAQPSLRWDITVNALPSNAS